MTFTRPQPLEVIIDGEHASIVYQLGTPSTTGTGRRFPEDGAGSIVFSRPSTGEDFEVEIRVENLTRILNEHRAAMASRGFHHGH